MKIDIKTVAERIREAIYLRYRETKDEIETEVTVGPQMVDNMIYVQVARPSCKNTRLVIIPVMYDELSLSGGVVVDGFRVQVKKRYVAGDWLVREDLTKGWCGVRSDENLMPSVMVQAVHRYVYVVDKTWQKDITKLIERDGWNDEATEKDQPAKQKYEMRWTGDDGVEHEEHMLRANDKEAEARADAFAKTQFGLLSWLLIRNQDRKEIAAGGMKKVAALPAVLQAYRLEYTSHAGNRISTPFHAANEDEAKVVALNIRRTTLITSWCLYAGTPEQIIQAGGHSVPQREPMVYLSYDLSLYADADLLSLLANYEIAAPNDSEAECRAKVKVLGESRKGLWQLRKDGALIWSMNTLPKPKTTDMQRYRIKYVNVANIELCNDFDAADDSTAEDIAMDLIKRYGPVSSWRLVCGTRLVCAKFFAKSDADEWVFAIVPYAAPVGVTAALYDQGWETFHVITSTCSDTPCWCLRRKKETKS